jgi:hypothetical protein
MTPKELEQSIRSLMQRSMADAELREQLEKLAAAEISLPDSPVCSGRSFTAATEFSVHPFAVQRIHTTSQVTLLPTDDFPNRSPSC